METLRFTSYIKDNQRTGEILAFHENGKMQMQGYEINQLKEGKRYSYHTTRNYRIRKEL